MKPNDPVSSSHEIDFKKPKKSLEVEMCDLK